MPAKRRNLSEPALRLVAQRFKALSEPSRLKLILALETGEKNVGELVEESGMTQANVSRHLQHLLEAGILARRRQGAQVFYRIADPRVFDLCEVVCGSLETHLEQQARAFR